jgi:pimeloyl-ACP methyl ester carboxylesterase
MPQQGFHFTNRRGLALSARLDGPREGAAVAYALFAHCFTCGKDIKAAYHIAQALNREGIGVLRFDFTGLGASQGEFADTNFSSNVADLIDAARYMESRGIPPRILIGHSLGGAAVIQAAAAIPAVRAVVTIAAPSKPSQLTHHLERIRDPLKTQGQADITIAGRRLTIKKQFLDDISQADIDQALKELDRALLILHSPHDTVVDIENAARLYRTAQHPKSFVSLDTADHLLSDPEDSRYAGGLIAAWVRRYLPTPST